MLAPIIPPNIEQITINKNIIIVLSFNCPPEKTIIIIVIIIEFGNELNNPDNIPLKLHFFDDKNPPKILPKPTQMENYIFK